MAYQRRTKRPARSRVRQGSRGDARGGRSPRARSGSRNAGVLRIVIEQPGATQSFGVPGMGPATAVGPRKAKF